MSMLDTLMGGAKTVAKGATDKVSDIAGNISESAGEVSSTVSDSLNQGMKKLEQEAQTSLMGMSHEQLQADMSQHESSHKQDYEMGF